MAQGSVNGRFTPGVSGNPGGRPRTQEVSAIFRRYTVDAARALVQVARCEVHPKHAGPAVAAARALVEFGYPGLQRGDNEGLAFWEAVHKHLLAASQLVPAEHNDSAYGPPVLEGDVVPAEQPGMLPAPDDSLPDEALPLWDAYRTRHATSVEPSAAPDQDAEGWEPPPPWPDAS
jgi:hypothetical protein